MRTEQPDSNLLASGQCLHIPTNNHSFSVAYERVMSPSVRLVRNVPCSTSLGVHEILQIIGDTLIDAGQVATIALRGGVGVVIAVEIRWVE